MSFLLNHFWGWLEGKKHRSVLSDSDFLGAHGANLSFSTTQPVGIDWKWTSICQPPSHNCCGPSHCQTSCVSFQHKAYQQQMVPQKSTIIIHYLPSCLILLYLSRKPCRICPYASICPKQKQCLMDGLLPAPPLQRLNAKASLWS